jgi:hypothetical protein
MPEVRPAPATTPGLTGYLAAWAVSLALVALLLPLVPPWDTDLGGYWVGVTFYTLYGGAASVLLAPVGLLVVHAACRRTPRQPRHVLAAAVCGLVAGVLVDLVLFSGRGLTSFALVMAAATATARAAVIPLVERRNEHLERRTPVPVDDDFRAGPPAC